MSLISSRSVLDLAPRPRTASSSPAAAILPPRPSLDALSPRRQIVTRTYAVPTLRDDLNVRAAIELLGQSESAVERHALCRLSVEVAEIERCAICDRD
jgi:hypothetical protein